MVDRILKPSKSQSFFLFGPRGSGKSTLLKAVFDNEKPLWIDLLDQRQELRLATDPERLDELWAVEKPKWIVIDEVQKNPRLLDVVHRMIESRGIKFALTGSSARKLKRGGANLLGGRAASYSLSPFSSYELGERFDLKSALETGLLPRFWDQQLSDIERVRGLYSYVQTYLKEEVAAEQLVRNLDPFRRVLVAAAQSNAKIVNHAAIERDAGVRHSQSERHFEILVDTLIGRYLEPFDTSIRKRQVKKSKFYFFDTGVVRALKNLAEEDLSASTYDYGEIFETFIINEFFKLAEALEKRWRFSYLRTQNDVEVDLIIEKPRGSPVLVEIKSSNLAPTSEKLSSFFKIAKEFKDSPRYFLSNSREAIIIDDIKCLHWRDGLSEIFEMNRLTEKSLKNEKPVPILLANEKSANIESIHPWRVCPYGKHPVIEHRRKNVSSKKPVSTVHWHCAENPSGKDHLYPEEIKTIAAEHFSNAKDKPCDLDLGYKNGSKFDNLIAGWVQYWNDILKPDVPLESNLVKALIASESSFYPNKLFNKKNSNSARGLMQITNASRKLLDNESELKDHFITVTKADLNDPTVNICAGVRWLFRKREIASKVRLRRQASWIEAAQEYKGDLEGVLNGNLKSIKDVDSFMKLIVRIEKCET